MNSAFLPNK